MNSKDFYESEYQAFMSNHERGLSDPVEKVPDITSVPQSAPSGTTSATFELLPDSAALCIVAPCEDQTRGFGVFAKRDLPAGTRVTCEKPLLAAPREPGTIDPVTVFEAFDELSGKEKETYMALSAADIQTKHALACMDDDLDQGTRDYVAKISSIFESNSFNIGEEDEDGVVMSAIFPLASRFNHECKPNVAQTWNENIKSLTIHAVRAVKEGEELCGSYVPLCRPSAARREELRAYGFECKCRVCCMADGTDIFQNTLRKSDRQRHAILRLGEDLNFYARRRRGSLVGPTSAFLVNDAGKDDPLNVLGFIEKLLHEEGLLGHDLCQ
jgi:hypothetical protein